MPYDETTNTHALCDYYKHDWKRHVGLSARQSKSIDVEVCQRNGCDAVRRIVRR